MFDFNSDVLRQRDGEHIARLKSLGFNPKNLTDNKAKLRDAYDERCDCWFEFKTDYYRTGRVAVEMVSNVIDISAAPPMSGKVIEPNDPEYDALYDYVYRLARDARHKSLATDYRLESNHFASYYLPNLNDSHLLIPIRDLQLLVLLGSYAITRTTSTREGRTWHAYSMLVPFEELAQQARRAAGRLN